MSVEIYNEGRVVGYSAYEIYVKQHLSENPDVPVASEREWLASSLAMGTSMLLKLPYVKANDEDDHICIDIPFPNMCILAAANTIIGSFFDGDAHFGAVGATTPSISYPTGNAANSITLLEGSSGWATRVTDYGYTISNKSGSPSVDHPNDESTVGTIDITQSVPTQEIKDWDENKKAKLRGYMKIVDGVILQPGMWRSGWDGDNQNPYDDFSPKLGEGDDGDISNGLQARPVLRLHVKGSVGQFDAQNNPIEGTQPLLLLTGFTIRSVLSGTVGTTTSLMTTSPQNGDFLGPAVFPWANKIVFSVPTSYIVYFESGSYKRKISPKLYYPDLWGDKDPIRVSDTPVIDMKSPSADSPTGEPSEYHPGNRLPAPVLENYYSTSMPETDRKFYENTSTDEEALGQKKRSRIPDEIHDFSTLGDGAAVLTVYSKKAVFPPALYGTFADSTDSTNPVQSTKVYLTDIDITEDSYEVTIPSRYDGGDVLNSVIKNKIEGSLTYNREVDPLIEAITENSDSAEHTYRLTKNPSANKDVKFAFYIVTRAGNKTVVEYTVNANDTATSFVVDPYGFTFTFNKTNGVVSLNRAGVIGTQVRSVSLIGVYYYYDGTVPISPIFARIYYKGWLKSEVTSGIDCVTGDKAYEPTGGEYPINYSSLEEASENNSGIDSCILGPVNSDDRQRLDRDNDNRFERDFAERQWRPSSPPISGTNITMYFRVETEDGQVIVHKLVQQVDYDQDLREIGPDGNYKYQLDPSVPLVPDENSEFITTPYFQLLRVGDIFGIAPAFIYPGYKNVGLLYANYTFDKMINGEGTVDYNFEYDSHHSMYYNVDEQQEGVPETEDEIFDLLYNVNLDDSMFSLVKGRRCEELRLEELRITVNSSASDGEGGHYLHPLDIVAPGSVKMFYNDDGTTMQEYQDTFEGTTAINKTEDGTLEVLDPTSSSTEIKKISVADQDVEAINYTHPETANSKSATTIVTAGSNKAKRTFIQTGKKQSVSLSVTDSVNKVTTPLTDGYKGTQITISQKPSSGITIDNTNANDFITWSALLAALYNDQGVDILAERLRSAKNHLIENNPASGTKNGPYLEFGPNGSAIRLYICKNEPETSGVPVGSIGIGWGFDPDA